MFEGNLNVVPTTRGGAPGVLKEVGVLGTNLAQNQPGLGPNRLGSTQTGTYRPIHGFGLIWHTGHECGAP
jgi:hypothetical protein